MNRYSVESDGQIANTFVTDLETGERMDGVSKVELIFDAEAQETRAVFTMHGNLVHTRSECSKAAFKSENRYIMAALEGMISAFIRCHPPGKAIDCNEFPEYENAIAITAGCSKVPRPHVLEAKLK